MRTFIFLALLWAFQALISPAFAHRSGCHRWHSCPSDGGTYTCGDLGYSNYCSKGGKAPKQTVSPPPKPRTNPSSVLNGAAKVKNADTISRNSGAPELRNHH